ncbi:hypothetical protein [Glaesserella parasuis]|uniref:hypothetical protein n=1 Tax=Glaesserella parasuis TaxID=738 RepID=UPI003B0B6ECF
MIIEEWQAKKLYINKEQLEKALGISLTDLPTKIFKYQEAIPDYLIIYQSMPYFDEYEATALLQGLNPSNYRYLRDKPHFYSIHKALLGAIKNNELGYSSYIDFLNGEPETLSIEHRALEKWAKHHGYKWELQPYQPLTAEPNTTTNNNNPDEISRLNAIIEQQTETIARLEAEIESLKKTETAESVVNYDECSIYGHTSENLEMLFTLAKKIASKCDPDNPHSYPNKDDFLNYVKKYHSDSSKLSEAFYQILTPEKVKNKGRTPKGVETFKGFI